MYNYKWFGKLSRKLFTLAVFLILVSNAVISEASSINMVLPVDRNASEDNNQVIEDDYNEPAELNDIIATVPAEHSTEAGVQPPLQDEETEENKNNVVPEELETVPKDSVVNGSQDEISNIKVPVKEQIEPVISVIFPTVLDFTIDPFDILGQGQIFSDSFLFENNSNVDVSIVLTDLVCRFADDEGFNPLAEPYSEEISTGSKDIYLYLQNISGWSEEMDIPDEWVITDPRMPKEVSFVLSCDKSAVNNKALFRLGGSVAQFPDKIWEDNDVKIEMTIRVEPVIDYGLEKIDLKEVEKDTASKNEDIPQSTLSPSAISDLDNDMNEGIPGNDKDRELPAVSEPSEEPLIAEILLPSSAPVPDMTPETGPEPAVSESPVIIKDTAPVTEPFETPEPSITPKPSTTPDTLE